LAKQLPQYTDYGTFAGYGLDLSQFFISSEISWVILENDSDQLEKILGYLSGHR
jgi:hypothetical protein